MKKQQTNGFTLIELMITIVIVSILVAVAYPAYLGQVRKTRRADCAAVLTGLAAAMERNFTENSSYQGLATAGANNGTPATNFYPGKCPIEGTNRFYNLTIAAPTPTTYTITATRFGAQAGERCGDLTLTNTGLKGIINFDAGATVAQCW